MERKWNERWERDTEIYSQEQVEAVIAECGIEIAYQSSTHFIGYCPFHSNDNSPAFEVDKSRGLYNCFNPGCGAAGNLKMLLAKIKGYNEFKATRCIVLAGNGSPVTDKLKEILQEVPEFIEFPGEPVNRMIEDFWVKYETGKQYMYGRDFTKDTLTHFNIGYSAKKNMVIVPMHDPSGMLVGFVGRSVEGKQFRNSDFLPKAKTAWNFHRAKKHGDTIIIVESSFDAMRIHQAGYPNVIALLGGTLSQWHIKQINRTFSRIIIMTDCEFNKRYEKNAKGDPGPCSKCKKNGFNMCQGHRDGREYGKKIVQAFPHKQVMWAAYDDTCVYPHEAKDAGDMTDQEIRQCLTNAVSNFEYQQWNPERLMDLASSSRV